ncbi:patatin-like phospholipase family protein [Patescibacteria group bacterium]|nr:patatin-like phospholipase family protein [Patescibacteria group bacterium]MBU1703469.1 patatin-like phospholipase family protein [Patescibacteria group bacterium]MBU1953449.1 patatin-like phospholipase family protein [Patescibacteria group bacterium]
MSDIQPKIGIAFGGGGAKGLAQIGIMKVLEKYNIKISSVAGTSAGAVIGGGIALGYRAEEIFQKIKDGIGNGKVTRISNLAILSESLIKDEAINKGIKSVFGDKTFKDLKIPFLATAVDLESGEEVVIKDGKLWEAARASSAIPFIISPYFLKGRYLVDGGLLNNVPVDRIREQKNIDIVIGIELGGMTSRQYISGMIWEKYHKKPANFKYLPSVIARWKTNTTLMAHVMLRSLDILRERELKARYKKAHPDIIIRPKLENISLLDFGKYQEAIDAGADAAEKIIPDLLKLMGEKRLKTVENGKKE